MNRDFERLLFRAHLARYDRDLWFGDCALVANVILCPNAQTRDTLERLFGARLRAVTSDITFRVGSVQDPRAEKGKPHWRIGDLKQIRRSVVPPKVSRKPDLLDE